MDARTAVETARGVALELHKLLVDEVRAGYERSHGKIGNPFLLLKLVMEDAAFAWLRPMSQLIVALDELLEQPAVTDDDSGAVRAQLEALLVRSDFHGEYVEILQRSPEIVMAHARMQRTIEALPKPSGSRSQ